MNKCKKNSVGLDQTVTLHRAFCCTQTTP